MCVCCLHSDVQCLHCTRHESTSLCFFFQTFRPAAMIIDRSCLPPSLLLSFVLSCDSPHYCPHLPSDDSVPFQLFFIILLIFQLLFQLNTSNQQQIFHLSRSLISVLSATPGTPTTQSTTEAVTASKTWSTSPTAMEATPGGSLSTVRAHLFAVQQHPTDRGACWILLVYCS